MGQGQDQEGDDDRCEKIWTGAESNRVCTTIANQGRGHVVKRYANQPMQPLKPVPSPEPALPYNEQKTVQLF